MPDHFLNRTRAAIAHGAAPARPLDATVRAALTKLAAAVTARSGAMTPDASPTAPHAVPRVMASGAIPTATLELLSAHADAAFEIALAKHDHAAMSRAYDASEQARRALLARRNGTDQLQKSASVEAYEWKGLDAQLDAVNAAFERAMQAKDERAMAVALRDERAIQARRRLLAARRRAD